MDRFSSSSEPITVNCSLGPRTVLNEAEWYAIASGLFLIERSHQDTAQMTEIGYFRMLRIFLLIKLPWKHEVKSKH